MQICDGAELCELEDLHFLHFILWVKSMENIEYVCTVLTDSLVLNIPTDLILTELEKNPNITSETNLKAVGFQDLTLNLTTCKCQPYQKPNNNPLYIKIVSDHPPDIIKNLASNTSKTIYQKMKQHLMIYTTTHLSKAKINIRLLFKNGNIYIHSNK